MRTAAAAERWARAHRDEYIRDLIGLINIRSAAQYGEGGFPMGCGCKQALDYFSSLARSYGFCAENDEEHSISVILPVQNQTRELGILGHLDVVPEGDGWTGDPYNAFEKNGFVVGRGACDNKGPVMMALYAMRCMRDLGIRLKSGIRLIAGCDEERDMRDIRHYLAGHEPPLFTLNCDGAWPVCIAEKGILTAALRIPMPKGRLIAAGGGEASNTVPALAWATLRETDPQKLNLLLSRSGCLSVQTENGLTTLRVHGKAAHCAYPRMGANAIRQLLRLLCEEELLTTEETRSLRIMWKAVQDDEGTGLRIRAADPLSGSTTAVPTLLSFADGQLTLRLNVRFSVSQTPELLLQRMRGSCGQLEISDVFMSPPRIDSPDQPEIRILLETCRDLVSRRCRPYASGGGTHSRLFPRSVPFGPGTLGVPAQHGFGGPHEADEAVCVDEMLQAIKVYIIALMRLDRYFDGSPF